MKSKEFDLDKWRVTPELAKAHDEAVLAHRKATTKTKPKADDWIAFVRFPVAAIDLLGGAKCEGTAKLFPRLLHLSWKNDHRPFRLSNTVLRPLGISRFRKGPVLRELEQMGLIRVEHRARKSPVVTVLVGTAGRKSVV